MALNKNSLQGDTTMTTEDLNKMAMTVWNKITDSLKNQVEQAVQESFKCRIEDNSMFDVDATNRALIDYRGVIKRTEFRNFAISVIVTEGKKLLIRFSFGREYFLLWRTQHMTDKEIEDLFIGVQQIAMSHGFLVGYKVEVELKKWIFLLEE